MLFRRISAILLWGFLEYSVYAANDLVINEIHYNPAEDGPSEFVELYNPTSQTLDLHSYSFTEGIRYTFPENAKISPNEYIVVVRFPSVVAWRSKSYQVFGPFIGQLDNGGEQLRLRSSDGRIVEELKYDDFTPWPRGADGYGSSLERIRPDLPADDFHSWRASLTVSTSPNTASGTPGKQNSVIDVPPKPVIQNWSIEPMHPTSQDSVLVKVTLDGADLIQRVTLLWETVREGSVSSVNEIRMNPGVSSGDLSVFEASLSPFTSQTLVRLALEVQLSGDRTIRLPHGAEPRPFESFFVYDGDIPARLPILWVYPNIRTSLTPTGKNVSGVVIQPMTGVSAETYDGARIESSRNGQKIRFLKGEEYNNFRTLNLIPERPSGGTTSGEQSPHVEQLSFRIFRDFDVLAPQCDWYRVIERGTHTQRILIEQPNEKFLERNGLDPDANIYKVAYNETGGFAKMTNVNDGVEDYQQLISALYQSSPSKSREAVYQYLVIDEVMNYSVAGVLMSNWDGFHNNLFLYHDPLTDKWQCIPWDLDKTFGYTDSDSMFVEMPLTFPLNGQAKRESRDPGRISRPFHSVEELNKEYIQRMSVEVNGLFSEERINGLIDETEQLLLDDLSLQSGYTKKSISTRQSQIITSYDTMRTFNHLRHEYLRGVLPLGVGDWPLY